MPRPDSTTQARPPRVVSLALTQAFAVGWVVQLLHAAHPEPGAPGIVAHWLRDASLAAPGVVVLTWLIARFAERILRGLGDDRVLRTAMWSLLGGVVLGLGTIPAAAAHGQLFVPGASASFWITASADAAVVAACSVVLFAAWALARGLPWEPQPRPRALRQPQHIRVQRTVSLRDVVSACRPTRRALAMATLTCALVISLLPGVPLIGADPAAAIEEPVPACGADSFDRAYDVAAVNVDVPFNRWGDVDTHGQIFVLQHDKEAVRNWHRPLAADPAADPAENRRLRPRPLVLRANAGECLQVQITNELRNAPGDGSGLPRNPRLGVTIRGASFDVQTSGGGAFGYNDDTTVPNTPGQNRITHYWTAPEEGLYFFHDTAASAGAESDGGSIAHGLFGALAVQPAGSTWTDPVSGIDLVELYEGQGDQSGEVYIDAIIHPPGARSFRETVQLAQDELPGEAGYGFNYSAESMQRRNEHMCPDCTGEETALSSWTYGDPGLVKLASGQGPWLPDPANPEGQEDCGLGTPGFVSDSCWTAAVTRAYVGDPFKLRYGMAGVKETHVFHLHNNTWFAQENKFGAAGTGPPSPGAATPGDSATVDSQAFGPMEMFTAELHNGAGQDGPTGSVGDAIFHCHLYPHFADGFWALLRIHDVIEDGTQTTPDGIRVRALQPLPSEANPAVPPEPTDDNPGFPRFIPGEFGWRAPQPPLGVTDADGEPAPRLVAGDEIDPDALAVEQAVMNRLSGGRAKPGAPFRDPCPPGAREITYDVSAIQLPITYNSQGDFDAQGRIVVHDDDVAAVLSGEKEPEPLFARVNAGDCVNWNLTNRMPNWFGNDAFVELTQTSMFGQHIHLVHYDILGSDGGSNGWNYQQAAFSRELGDFQDALADDEEACTPLACRIPTPDSVTWTPSATSLDDPPGQTIHQRWYAGYELRTVFTHDHHFAAINQNRGQYGALVVEPAGMDFRDPRTGEWFQPIDNETLNGDSGRPVCATACVGTAVGTMMDIIGPGDDDDFREFGLAVQDFTYLTREGGDPTDPRDVYGSIGVQEHFPDRAHGVNSINYRSEMLRHRRTTADGQPADPAYVFSSYVHGDPATPLLRAYAGDRVRVRLIQGSHEEQHAFTMHGTRWRQDGDDPGSPWVNNQSIGISEAFNLVLPPLPCGPDQDCRGDFLYGGTSLDSVYAGMWGIFRVHGRRVPGLLPLPDNVPLTADPGDLPSGPTGAPPPPAVRPGNPCPASAPRTTFDVVALEATITYNDAGDHDPYGLVYALAEDAPAIRDGANPEPLVIRANAGDCIEVTLTNELTEAWLEHDGVNDGDAPQFAEPAEGTPGGLRVSMHPQLVSYDIRGSDGTAVGYNPDQTVGPGESIQYRWYADEIESGELGATNLTDFGDARGHRHHGLFGALSIQPAGSTYHDPFTGEELRSGPIADIRVPGEPSFRESTLIFQDGLNLRDVDGNYIEDPHPPDGDHPPIFDPPLDAGEAEDAGEKGINYRAEAFRHRLGVEPAVDPDPTGDRYGGVYSSELHGDPSTPVVRAYAGDDVRLRVLSAGDKHRPHVFQLTGHAWRNQPDERARLVGSHGGVSGRSAFSVDLTADTLATEGGDHLYSCSLGLFHRSAGLWGLMRVYPQPTADRLRPTPLGERDDPRGGAHPLLPLDVEQVRVLVFRDLDGDGVQGPGEPVVQEAEVTAASDGSAVTEARTGFDGWAALHLPVGVHDVTAVDDDGWSAPSVEVVTTGDGTTTVRLGLRDPNAEPPGDQDGSDDDDADGSDDSGTDGGSDDGGSDDGGSSGDDGGSDDDGTDTGPGPPAAGSEPEPGDDTQPPDGDPPGPPPGPSGPPGSTVGGIHRLSGPTRIETAIAVSQAAFPDGSASVAVLARADDFPDALAGAPLAAAKEGPLLLTGSSTLDPAVRDELARVVRPGGTAYLLGGQAALAPDVSSAVSALGLDVVRLAGPDRFATAVAIATEGIGDPSAFLMATGIDFPDALAAGAAAASIDGAVLLTAGTELPPIVEGVLAANPGVERWAVGGPAADADSSAIPLRGTDRFDTSVLVATQLFDNPAAVAVASGLNFPDALAGGAHIAGEGGPLLLTAPAALPDPVARQLTRWRDHVTDVWIYGGTAAVSSNIDTEIRSALTGEEPR